MSSVKLDGDDAEDKGEDNRVCANEGISFNFGGFNVTSLFIHENELECVRTRHISFHSSKLLYKDYAAAS